MFAEPSFILGAGFLRVFNAAFVSLNALALNTGKQSHNS